MYLAMQRLLKYKRIVLHEIIEVQEMIVQFKIFEVLFQALVQPMDSFGRKGRYIEVHS